MTFDNEPAFDTEELEALLAQAGGMPHIASPYRTRVLEAALVEQRTSRFRHSVQRAVLATAVAFVLLWPAPRVLKDFNPLVVRPDWQRFAEREASAEIFAKMPEGADDILEWRLVESAQLSRDRSRRVIQEIL